MFTYLCYEKRKKRTGMKKTLCILLALLLVLLLYPYAHIVAEEKINQVSKIVIDQKKVLLAPGYSDQLIYKVMPENASDSRIKWISSNEKIATVDQKGIITGHAVGKCTITGKAESNNKIQAKVSVQVKEYNVVLRMFDKRQVVDFDTAWIKRYQKNDYIESDIKFSSGCVECELNCNKSLVPIKPGECIITVTERNSKKKVVSKKKYTVLVLEGTAEERAAEEMRKDVRFLNIPWGITFKETAEILELSGMSVNRTNKFDTSFNAFLGMPAQFCGIPANYIEMWFDGSDLDSSLYKKVEVSFDSDYFLQMKESLEEKYQLTINEDVSNRSNEDVFIWKIGKVLIWLIRSTKDSAELRMSLENEDINYIIGWD